MFAPEGQANKLTKICRIPTLKKTLLSVLASKIKTKTIGELEFVYLTYISRRHKQNFMPH